MSRLAHSPRHIGIYRAGCRMPSNGTIEAGDRQTRLAAEEGSRALLEAIRGYFNRGGRG